MNSKYKNISHLSIQIVIFILFIFVSTTPAHATEQPSNNKYLFAYFKQQGEHTGTGFHPGDGLHLAWSDDGLAWSPLNGDRVLFQPRHSTSFRDPDILPGPDGVYHLVWTAWNGVMSGVGYASSTDLIHWSDDLFLPVMSHEPGALNVWAPEIFFDHTQDRYMIFWSSTIPGRFPKTHGFGDGEFNHRIYYTTTANFENFTTAELLIDPGFNCIDATINKVADGRYLMFLKNETLMPPRKNIVMSKAQAPGGPWSKASKPITPPGVWSEGPTAIRINDVWYVYFDRYTMGSFGLITSPDLKTWTDRSEDLSMPPGIRHGTVFTVPDTVLEKLMQR